MRVIWAFRLFVVSFIAFFALSIFFFPTYTTTLYGYGYRTMVYVSSIFGLVAANVAAYILLVVVGIWIAGWAFLWGEHQSKRPRTIIIGSWMIPCSIVYAWVTSAVALMAGIPRYLISVIAFAPPLLVAVVAPQLFVRGLLGGRERMLSQAALGAGFFLVGAWGTSSSLGAGALSPMIEILLPVYFGLLVIEYLAMLLKLNNNRF